MNRREPQSAQELRVLVVDDEKLARNFLLRMLSKDEAIHQIEACGSVSEARRCMQQFHPDILFLDVQMPGASGFQLLEMLPSGEHPVVVFTTAFAQFATRAFDVQACDYLLKPFDEDRLFLALDRAREALKNHLKRVRSPMRITVPLGDRAVRLSADEIDWMAADDNYVRICCGKKTLMVRSTLERLERDLKSEMLLRVHRSWIINLKSVKEVRYNCNHQYALIMADGTTVTCSRRYKHLLRSALGI
jgi:two-component system LytT family response regulator